MIHFYEKKRLLRKYNNANKVFITISNDSDYYAKYNIFPKNLADKVIKLENAINHSSFANPDYKKSNKDEISIINVGNLLKKKNQIFIIDIVSYLLFKRL